MSGSQPVVHGSVSGAELAQYGLRLEDVLDFSVNTNPLGPAPCVVRAIDAADWTRYPGDDELALRIGLAERAGLTAEDVVLGNGAVELLWLAALAFLVPGERAAIVGPTFGEYTRAVHVAGGVLAQPGTRARLGYVCNPNNPTGEYRSREQIAAISADTVVLDEAYVAFVDEPWDAAQLVERGNVVVVRSMTKDHALPGLRLGYALASPELARRLDGVRPPWSVNAGALRAGLAALQPEAEAHVARAREVVRQSRALLTRGFSARGYNVLPSRANFVLVEVGHATSFRARLMARGVVVRDCTSFGLAEHIRVACRRPEECERLLDAL